MDTIRPISELSRSRHSEFEKRENSRTKIGCPGCNSNTVSSFVVHRPCCNSGSGGKIFRSLSNYNHGESGPRQCTIQRALPVESRRELFPSNRVQRNSSSERTQLLCHVRRVNIRMFR